MAHQGQEISNPRTGQWTRFVSIEPELMRMETVIPPTPEDESEPLHIHPYQESGMEVVSGSLEFEVAGERKHLEAGESLTIPAGVPHRFWNEGTEPARATGHFAPALDIAGFFEYFFALAEHGQLDEKGMPKPLPLVALIGRFGDEIRPVSPPWPLLRVVGAALGPLARARGRSQGWLLAG